MRVAMLAWGTTLIFAGDLAPLQLSTIEISIFALKLFLTCLDDRVPSRTPIFFDNWRTGGEFEGLLCRWPADAASESHAVCSCSAWHAAWSTRRWS